MTVSYSGNFIRLLLRWKGSIWRSVWIELLVFLSLFYTIRLFYYYGIPAIDIDDSLGYKCVFCVCVITATLSFPCFVTILRSMKASSVRERK